MAESTRSSMAQGLLTRTLAAVLLMGAALTALAVQAQADTQADVLRARQRQDRQLAAVASRGKAAILRVAEGEVKRAERENTPLQHYLAGRALYKAQEKRRAFGHLRTAWRTEPEIWQAGVGLVLLYMDFKQQPDALKILEQVRARVPNELEPMQMHLDLLIRAKRYPETLPVLEALVRAKPAELPYRTMLARAYTAAERWEEARAALAVLRGSSIWRQDPELVLMLADAELRLERFDDALISLKEARSGPAWEKVPRLQWQLGRVYLQKKDLVSGARELSAYLDRAPQDAEAAVLLANVLLDLGRPEEVVRLGERMREANPNDPDVHGFLADCYVRTGRLRDALGALKQLEPMLEAGERRESVLNMIRALEAGRDPRQPLPPPGAADPKPILIGPKPMPAPDSPYQALILRCIDPSVDVRRKAMQELYEANLEIADPLVYQRMQPAIEPDAEVRVWVVRILGRFDIGSTQNPGEAREVARQLAYGLDDPDGRVRRVAADELGTLGVKAALLYLLPYFASLPVEAPPTEEAPRKILEQEFNAIRGALVRLTSRQDRSAAQEPWVSLEEAKANRDGWFAWLDGPTGEIAKLAALDDLDALVMPDLPERRPDWIFSFAYDHCFPPTQWSVAKRAYQLLWDARPRTNARTRHAIFWRGFPVITDEELETIARAELTARVATWIRNLTGARTPK